MIDHSRRWSNGFGFGYSGALILLLGMVLVAVSVSQQPARGSDPRTQAADPYVATPVSQASQRQGLQVYLDEYGRPTVPPPDARPIVPPPTSRTVPLDEQPPSELDAPGGGTVVRLGGRFRSYSVARVGADGQLFIACNGSEEHRHAQRGTEPAGTSHGQLDANPSKTGGRAAAAPRSALPEPGIPQDSPKGRLE
jgi:hypothetical protein